MVQNMVTSVTDAIGGLLTGVGSAVTDFFDCVVLNEAGELSTFAVWTLAFLGVGFGFGVVKFITNLVRR